MSSALDPGVEVEIERALPVGDTVYVLGGDLALSPDIDATLEGLGYRVVREAGVDEYATAVDIAQQLGNPSTIFEATGLSFYDALSAVPAAIENLCLLQRHLSVTCRAQKGRARGFRKSGAWLSI